MDSISYPSGSYEPRLVSELLLQTGRVRSSFHLRSIPLRTSDIEGCRGTLKTLNPVVIPSADQPTQSYLSALAVCIHRRWIMEHQHISPKRSSLLDCEDETSASRELGQCEIFATVDGNMMRLSKTGRRRIKHPRAQVQNNRNKLKRTSNAMALDGPQRRLCCTQHHISSEPPTAFPNE